MIHKHKYKISDFTICINGIIAPKGYCINIYKCEKCGKIKVGELRKLEKEECLFMANRYKKHIESKGDDEK